MTLAVALVASLAALILSRGDDSVPVSPGADPTTTTSTALPTTTTSVPDRTTTTGIDEPEPNSPSDVLVAIKVDNSPAARPQYGLGQAPLLVEYPVEGGLTRFTAFYPEGMSGLVGPVRSLRPTDADLLPALTDVVVSTGGRDFVLRDIDATGLINVVAQFSSMFVSVGRPDPYDTFADLEVLDGLVGEVPKEPAGLPSGDLPEPEGSADEIALPFDSATLTWDPGRGYLHMRSGEELETLSIDGSGPSQLTHDQVVVVYAAERSAGYVDSNGVSVNRYDVIGGGDLLVFANGAAYVGSWFRGASEDMFEFFDSRGNPFGLPDGRTYLAVVPRGSQVSFR